MKIAFTVLVVLTAIMMGCSAAPTVPAAPTATAANTETSVPAMATMPAPTGISLRPSATALLTTIPASRRPTETPQRAPTLTQAPRASNPAPPTVSSFKQPSIVGRLDLLTLPGEGRGPTAIAQLGETIYVANRGSDNLAVIRGGRVQAFIPTAKSPTALVADPAHTRLYAATYVSPTLMLIENETVVKRVELADRVNALVLVGDKVYLANDNNATIQVRDAATLEQKASVRLNEGFAVFQLVADAPRGRLYANVYGRVVAIDLASLKEVGSFEVPYLYQSLVVDPADGSIWGGLYDEQDSHGYLAHYEPTGKEIGRLQLDPGLRQPVFDSSGRIYLASSDLNRVDIVDTHNLRFIQSINVGLNPYALWLDDGTHSLYVANQGSDSVSVINTRELRVTVIVPVGMNIKSLLASPERGRIYAANASTDSVFVIEDSRIVAQVPVGHNPVDLARDSKTNRLFVASSADGVLSVIDEQSLKLIASEPITRGLSSVAVDAPNRLLFADSAMYKLDGFTRQGTFLARGFTIGSLNPAEYVRVNPARKKIYVLAHNGIPGSNARTILYTFSETNLSESKVLGGGNVTALEIDPETQRVYASSTHPLAFNSFLDVWDADDHHLTSLGLSSRTSGMAVNPRTHHLFLAHAFTYEPQPGVLRKRDNAVQILDTRTLGEVGWLDVPGEPGPIAVIGDFVYVAGTEGGAVTIIADGETRQPPAPTATFTPTSYPTLKPEQIPPTFTPAHSQTSTPAGTLTSATATRQPFTATSQAAVDRTPCSNPGSEQYLSKWKQVDQAKLGCPIYDVVNASFAFQPFSGGYMFDDLRGTSTKLIYVFFADHMYQYFLDTWQEGDPDDSCPAISVPANQLKPRRGFGKLWCENESVRSRLSGAIEPERGITLFYQKFEHGYIWNAAPYVIALYADGTWQ